MKIGRKEHTFTQAKSGSYPGTKSKATVGNLLAARVSSITHKEKVKSLINRTNPSHQMGKETKVFARVVIKT